MKSAIINHPKEHKGKLTDLLYSIGALWIETPQPEKNERLFTVQIEGLNEQQYQELTKFLSK